MTWVRSLDLKQKNISDVNFQCVLTNFPNITIIDLRQSPFNCVKTKLMHVRSDCEYTTTTRSNKPSSISITILSTTFSVQTNLVSTTPSTFVKTSTPHPLKNNETNLIIILITILSSVSVLFVVGLSG